MQSVQQRQHPGRKTGGGTGGGGSVSFVTALAEDERQVVGDLLKGFESSAGIQVKMVQMESQDVVNQLKAKKTANKMDVDLIAQDNLRLGPLVRDGIVEDLSGEQARVPDTTIDALKPVTSSMVSRTSSRTARTSRSRTTTTRS